MARPGVRRCDVNNDCFNCPYPDCISGEPIVKEIDTSKIANSMINKKYYGTDKAKARNIIKCRKYKERNKDKVYAKNAEWVEKHREDVNKIRRKYLRKKRIEEGSYKFVGTINYEGHEAFVYCSKYGGKNNYFGFLGKKYFELEEDEICWLWIKRCV